VTTSGVPGASFILWSTDMSLKTREHQRGADDGILHSDILAGTAYRAIQKLGEGAMGFVVEAEHLALGHLVVVKLLHQALAQRADFVDRMRIEAQSLARLRHPNLVAVTDFSVTPNGIPFLVMERLAGRTVAEERTRRGALPVDEAIDIAQQTLAGLRAVHEAGIVHRDIKAANLFLCDDAHGRRTVKILDFGIAKVLASAPSGRAPQPLRYPTAEGVTVGTPRCLSPEQARGAPIDQRTDVYAVGVLLYSLLVGAGPFDHLRNAVELLHAHVSITPVVPSLRAKQSISPELDAAIMRALAKRPEDRFATAAEFSTALAEATEAEVERFDTDPQPMRFDTEPLPPPASTACDFTVRIPSVLAHDEQDDAPTMQISRAAERLVTRPVKRPLGIGASLLVLTLSALASAGVAGFIAWVWVFR
jgi:serine/threonine-protein kinase